MVSLLHLFELPTVHRKWLSSSKGLSSNHHRSFPPQCWHKGREKGKMNVASDIQNPQDHKPYWVGLEFLLRQHIPGMGFSTRGPKQLLAPILGFLFSRRATQRHPICLLRLEPVWSSTPLFSICPAPSLIAALPEQKPHVICIELSANWFPFL